MRLLATVLASIAVLTGTGLVDATSIRRNPLQSLAVVHNATIKTPSHRVTALHNFDLFFTLYDSLHVRLGLEPNHDIIPEGANVKFLDADGSIIRQEPVNRLDHKIFKGAAWIEQHDESWKNVGWARIMIRQDGIRPLFEGSFSIGRNAHHIQLSSSYTSTKHELDPDIEPASDTDEYMVLWRDSDVSKDDTGLHEDLRRSVTILDDGLNCQSDSLSFNMQPDHPVYMNMMKRDDTFWGVMPMTHLFGKRQIDTQPGSGNSAGVNLVSTIGQTAGCPTTRKVALVGVATDCTYTGTFPNSSAAHQNVINVMNQASNLYETTFNITLGVKDLVVLDANCPGTPPQSTPWNEACSDSINIQDRLNTFSQWRADQHDNHSHWTLLTNCNSGATVGLAWLGQACVSTAQTANSSTGGGSETVSGANVVAKTNTEWQVIAHETGHTFGAVHDCTTQTCSDGNTVNAQQCCPLSSSTCDAGEQYIMNPSTSQGINNFSPCSVGNICSAMGRNSVKTTCLSDNKGVTTISGQQCGNGIVEDGEDCDCGGTDGCGNNACCDPKTCKFVNTAVCDDSNEDCCHSCQFASNGTVCRASTGSCDPQEVCTGNSPTCPSDVTTPDGQSCGSSGMRCASGQCTSRDQQCKTVMGSYTQGNDTFACDDSTCAISCQSPEFGTGVCYGLQQNFLDGTPCGGGGTCSNGQCKGSTVGGAVKSFYSRHKGVVIGVAAAIGALILLSILGCLIRCFRRRRRFTRPKKLQTPPPGTMGGIPPTYQNWNPLFANRGQNPNMNNGVVGGMGAVPPGGIPGNNAQSWQQQSSQWAGTPQEASLWRGQGGYVEPPPAAMRSVRYA
ncbi:MAG: hypothetical protein M1820_007857 [Bogoriella megaspora]|nr:MAG: hypothetical protein M1820_007857 [Bogoriella megaspora]